ncbi:Potassium voltage-gated channel subfamily C member 1 [Exaiptasia diaphana]|nr:Potassium voltage-gated channel subfamily C member 1 [Exaiptasia diaphana]
MSFPARTGDEQDKIYINVGGKHHESYLSTLRNIPDTRLAWMAESLMAKKEDGATRKELFFDRHPDLFGLILNYYRTGKLHAPRDVCGPLFQEELQFWGIEEKEMEACCWPNYTQHREAEKNLKEFVGPEFEEDEGDEEENTRDRQNSFGSLETGPSLWNRLQRRIWSVMDDAFSSVKAKIFAMVSLLMILVSVVLMCTASLPAIRNDDTRRKAFQQVEYFFCAWFTLEFVMRLIFCPNKIEFFKQVMTWIDILSLVPYYRKIFWFKSDLDFLRAIRLIRLFRAFRFFTFTSGLQIIVQSLKASFRELMLLAIILIIPIVVFSSIVYEFEKTQQPVKFNSIPQTFWWAVITMTTVGYGDMSPLTLTGQLMGSICAICGVLIIGLPVSVIGNNFSTYYEHAQARLSLPKKKRRLIIADRLKLMQGQSNSSAERIQQEQDSDKNAESDDSAIDGMPKNFRRYHRRSRNTIFARGDVYIGEIKKPKVPGLETQIENPGDERVIDDMEKGEGSKEQDVNYNKSFNLTNNPHESEEIVEEARNKSLDINNRKRKCGDTKSMIELKSLDRPPNRSDSPRATSVRSFKSRISPTPQDIDPDEGNDKPSRRLNKSLTLPPLTVFTHAKTKKDDESDYTD